MNSIKQRWKNRNICSHYKDIKL